jgi:DNA-binding NtrC family response regulator
MTETEATVFVVDDDAPMRESLKNLIRSVGLRAEVFFSGGSSVAAAHDFNGPLSCASLCVARRWFHLVKRLRRAFRYR